MQAHAATSTQARVPTHACAPACSTAGWCGLGRRAALGLHTVAPGGCHPLLLLHSRQSLRLKLRPPIRPCSARPGAKPPPPLMADDPTAAAAETSFIADVFFLTQRHLHTGLMPAVHRCVRVVHAGTPGPRACCMGPCAPLYQPFSAAYLLLRGHVPESASTASDVHAPTMSQHTVQWRQRLP
jgi:hypothetical protein